MSRSRPYWMVFAGALMPALLGLLLPYAYVRTQRGEAYGWAMLGLSLWAGFLIPWLTVLGALLGFIACRLRGVPESARTPSRRLRWSGGLAGAAVAFTPLLVWVNLPLESLARDVRADIYIPVTFGISGAAFLAPTLAMVGATSAWRIAQWADRVRRAATAMIGMIDMLVLFGAAMWARDKVVMLRAVTLPLTAVVIGAAWLSATRNDSNQRTDGA